MIVLFTNIFEIGATTSKVMVDITLNIVLSSVTMLVALAIGLLLRRSIVRYLKKTVLDNWIIQILGILIIIPPLIAGAVVALAIWNNLFFLLDQLKNQYHIDPLSIGIQLLSTLLVLGVGIGIARTLNKLVVGGLGEKRIDINIRTLLGRIFYIVALLITSFWILSLWQIPLGIPVAGVGVLTVAFTFAVQDILKDLVAGFYILLERPFFIGDQISVTIAPTVIYVGKVEDVRLRATKMRLVSGEEVTVPNAILFGNVVTNNTYYGERRGTIMVTLPKEDFSPELTKDKIPLAIKELGIVQPKPEPIVLINAYTDEKITLVVRFWLASDHTLDVSEVMYTLHTLLPQATLEAREPADIL